MEAMNIRQYSRGNDHESNYRLLEEPLKLKVRIIPVLDADGTDSWETDGGALAPAMAPFESTTEQVNRSRMTVKGARKQRAARMCVSKESIKIVHQSGPRSPGELEPELGAAVQVAQLEAKIKALLGLVQKREQDTCRLDESINTLMSRVNGLRTKV